MTRKANRIEPIWGTYQVGDEPDTVDEVHVVPHYGDLLHSLSDVCACEPEVMRSSQGDLPIYVHKVVYYN